jgi:hypothetical protein
MCAHLATRLSSEGWAAVTPWIDAVSARYAASHARFSDPYNPHLFVLTGKGHRRQRGNLRGCRSWAWPPTCVVQHDGDGSLSVLVLAVAALPLVGFLMESAPPPLPQGSNRTPVAHRD